MPISNLSYPWSIETLAMTGKEVVCPIKVARVDLDGVAAMATLSADQIDCERLAFVVIDGERLHPDAHV